MPYTKYLKPGQKVLLRALGPEVEDNRFEALTAFIRSLGAGHLELTLPYHCKEGEEYPFRPDMTFELLSDALGLGVRLTGQFQGLEDRTHLRLRHNRDLQLIRRRNFRRRDATIGLRYTKGRGELRTFREQWEKNVRILGEGRANGALLSFPRCRVNLSGGGVRLALKTPVEVADLCLLLLALPDEQPPICALAEVVWLADEVVEGRCNAGMQFLQILETDRRRIEKFIAQGDSEDAAEENRRATG